MALSMDCWGLLSSGTFPQRRSLSICKTVLWASSRTHPSPIEWLLPVLLLLPRTPVSSSSESSSLSSNMGPQQASGLEVQAACSPVISFVVTLDSAIHTLFRPGFSLASLAKSSAHSCSGVASLVCCMAALLGNWGWAVFIGALPLDMSGSDTTLESCSAVLVLIPEDSSSSSSLPCKALSWCLAVATNASNLAFSTSLFFFLKKSGNVWNPWACRSLRAFFCLLMVLSDLPV